MFLEPQAHKSNRISQEGRIDPLRLQVAPNKLLIPPSCLFIPFSPGAPCLLPRSQAWIFPHPRPAHTLAILRAVSPVWGPPVTFGALAALLGLHKADGPGPKPLSVRGTVPKCKRDPAGLPRSSPCLLPLSPH